MLRAGVVNELAGVERPVIEIYIYICFFFEFCTMIGRISCNSLLDFLDLVNFRL